MHHCAWLLLLLRAAARSGYLLQVLECCFNNVLDMHIRDVSWDLASVPLSSGGLGLRSSNQRQSAGAAWCRWADALATIQRRHPAVATLLIGQASVQDSTCWEPLNRTTVWVMGSTVQSGARSLWENIFDSSIPFRMGRARRLQHSKKSLHEFLQEHIHMWLRYPHTSKVLLRSRGGQVMACPSCAVTRLEPLVFLVLLLCRLWLPLHPTQRTCHRYEPGLAPGLRPQTARQVGARGWSCDDGRSRTEGGQVP